MPSNVTDIPMSGAPSMLPAIQKNLEICAGLVKQVPEDVYRDSRVAPYYSSVGSHVRHSLDVFDCILSQLGSGHVDLTARARNSEVETERCIALSNIHRISRTLNDIPLDGLTQLVQVHDDLGLGGETHIYTLGAALIQAHSHMLHHFACIGYVLSALEVDIPSERFGINPTTPVR